jgi:hypothetical protein
MSHHPPSSFAARRVIGALLLVGCGGGITPLPAPVPATTPAPSASAVTSPRATRVALPASIPSTTWRVEQVARLLLAGERTEQTVSSRAVVSWAFERQPHGGLRGSGQVDSFTVTTSFEAPSASTTMPPGLLLLDATLDSTVVRVTSRPPLVNECDRPESGAILLARELLVRVPDGARAGDRWQDSSVSLVCRSGVPVTVYTTVANTLERLDDQRIVVTRDIVSRLEGKGGSPFRGLEVTGTGSGAQRAEIGAVRGTLELLEGTHTLTLQTTERMPGTPPRTQQVVQQGRVTAVRAR